MELTTIRKEMSMTQKELAYLLDRTVSCVSKKEKGTRKITLEEAKKIAAKYYEITGKYLDITKL